MVIYIDDFAKNELDEFNLLLSGNEESISQIFHKDKSQIDELQTSRNNRQLLLKETAILDQSLAGKSIELDSTVAVDAEFIVNVNKQIDELSKELSPRITKPETLSKKLAKYSSLFDNDLKEIVSILSNWSNGIRAYDQVDIDDDEIDLIVKHYAAILESTRLDKEIEAIEADIAILEVELS